MAYPGSRVRTVLSLQLKEDYASTALEMETLETN